MFGYLECECNMAQCSMSHNNSLEYFLIFSVISRTLVQLLASLSEEFSLLKMSDQRYSSLAASLEKVGQAHVLQWWPELDNTQKEQLARELEELDLTEMEEMYRRSCLEASDRDMSSMEPVEASLCQSVLTSSPETLQSYTRTALTEAAAGRVGVLLLAGGQGTRLGVCYPKGMYNIGLPSNKTLYQIQIERILRLQVITGGQCP